jgi:RNA polymerase sigma factor (TIGR02999 family)
VFRHTVPRVELRSVLWELGVIGRRRSKRLKSSVRNSNVFWRAPAHGFDPSVVDVTDALHEAFIRLVGRAQDRDWCSRGHFFAAAAESMRRILIENARRKQRIKRGGGVQREPVDDLALDIADPPEELLELDAAFGKLALHHPAQAELVKLRYFAGLTNVEAAKTLGISTSTADRHWTYARAWLYREIEGHRRPTFAAPELD